MASSTGKLTLVWERCGQPFEVPPSRKERRFCGRDCKYAHQARHRVTRTCERCGAGFTVQASRHTARFCSIACHAEARRIIVVSQCLACGRDILDNQPRQFCDWNCSGAYRRNRIWKRCDGCGKRFSVYPSMTRLRFCSRGCWHRYVGETSIERLMREALSERRVAFLDQHRVGPFRVDFYLPGHNAVVETEGTYWHSLPQARVNDWKRMALLGRGGFQLFRCAEEDVRKDALALVDDMLAILEKGDGYARLFKPWGVHARN